MTNRGRNYRFVSDDEPDERDLAALMHEVAVEAKRKSVAASQEMTRRIKTQIREAFVREGLPYK
jgi:hypothetical protein